jgi:uncharacterized protein with beta-barrel porin domain
LITNSGSLVSGGAGSAAVAVAGSNNTLMNAGLIEAIADGIRLEGTGNHAHITAAGTVVAGTGIRVGGSGSVLNEGRILGEAAGGVGVLFTGSGGSATNRGSIVGRAGGVHFNSTAGSTGTLTNEVGGNIVGAGAATILGGEGSERIANHGRIVAGPGVAVDLGGGADELLITATSSISGTTHGGAGFDTFIVGGAVSSQFNLSNIGPVIDGWEIFRKQGSSTWTLFGNAVSDWTVDQGTLGVDGGVVGTVSTTAGGVDPLIDVVSTGVIRRGDGLPAVILNGAGTLSNGGRLVTTAAGGAAVEALGDGNLVTNSGTVDSGGAGIQFAGDGNVFTNFGIVRTAGSAVVMSGRNSLFNVGLLQAAGTGPAVRAVGDGNIVENGGDLRSTGVGAQFTGDRNAFENLRTMQAGGSAVVLNGAGNTIFNSGAIDVTGPAAALQAFGAGNRIANFGTVRSAGAGMQIFGDGNLLDNLGTLRTSGTGISIAGAGNSISNTGSIDATGSDGLRADGSGNRIVNTGTVQAAGVGVRLAGGSNALDNAGTVLGDRIGVELAGNAGSVFNRGEIRSSRIGALITGRDNHLTNDGVISGGAFGIRTEGLGSTLENRGMVLADGVGVLIAGSGESLANMGAVRANGAAVRVDSSAGANTSISNAVDSVIQSLTGTGIAGGDGNERVENHGVLIGGGGLAADLGGGNDVFHLTTTALLGGIAHGGSGVDTLELAGTGAVRTDLGSYLGFETLSKLDTGTWALTGSGDMAWTINAGQLVVEGTLGGEGIVRAGSRLGGAGTVGGFVNEGTVAPGNSIGTLRVTGDYEHAAGAAMEIEAAINGESDALRIDGRALLRGGTVAVTPESRPFGIATEFTIVNAAGGVTGTFGRATSSLSHLDPQLDYQSQKVFLTLIRNDISFRSMSTGTNLRSLGTALDANKQAMARGDFKILMDQFLFMDAEQQRSSLRTLSGELHASTARTLLRTGSRFFSASVDRQLSAQRLEEDRKTFWADAFGFTGSVETDGNASAVSYSAAGIAAGIDLALTEGTRLGAAFGYSPGTTELDRFATDSANVRSYHPAMYGEHDAGSWSLGAGFGYSRHDVRASRAVEVGPIARQASINYEANQYTGQLAAAFSLYRTRAVSLKGFGELRYSRLFRPSFDEVGAESANLTGVSEARAESLRSVLGVRASWQPKIWGMALLPEVKLGWTRESLDRQGELTAALSGAAARPGAQQFSVLGATEARDGLLFSLGASTAPLKRGRAFVAYDRLFTGQGFEHGFAAGVRVGW